MNQNEILSRGMGGSVTTQSSNNFAISKTPSQNVGDWNVQTQQKTNGWTEKDPTRPGN